MHFSVRNFDVKMSPCPCIQHIGQFDGLLVYINFANQKKSMVVVSMANNELSSKAERSSFGKKFVYCIGKSSDK